MIDIRYLAGVLRQLADAGHPEAVPKIIAAWGGTRRSIPQQPREGDELVRIIGLPAARALAQLRGGEEVDIPRGANLGAKKQAVLRMADRPAREIVQAVGCTDRFVRMARNSGKPDPDQGNLF